MSSQSKRQVFKSAAAKKAAPAAKQAAKVATIVPQVVVATEEEVKQQQQEQEQEIETADTTATSAAVVVPAKKSASELAAIATEKKAAVEAKKLRTSIVAAAKAAIGRVGLAPIDAGAVKKSHIVIIKGQPCKIMEIRHSKTGKHGHTRVRMTGISLIAPFAKLECLYPAHVMVPQCNVNKGVYDLLAIVGEPKRVNDTAAETKYRSALELALPALAGKTGNGDDEEDKESKQETKKKPAHVVAALAAAAAKKKAAAAVESDTDEDSDASDAEVSEEEVASDSITIDVLDGKYPRRIICGIAASDKEALLASRATDGSLASGVTAGEYVYQVTVVEAPVLPGNRKLTEEEMSDDVTVKATLQLWRRAATIDLPKKR